MIAVDLFAGPGGWDVAAKQLGIDPLGFELDDWACKTRREVGHRTLQVDVADYSPAECGGTDLLIASPPCQGFSRAGKRRGLSDLDRLYGAALSMANEDLEPEDITWDDPRSALILQPLRWALALKPRYLAFEQVPDVLPFWEHIAKLLDAYGWHTWVGILEAERYGVPQTRERAFLMADRERQPHPPRPTHQRYVKGEAARHEATLEGEILPWVSMAEALNWGTDDQVGFPRRDDSEDSESEYRERDRRPASEPSFTLSEKARSWTRVTTNNLDGTTGERYEREADAPAPTVTSRADLWELDEARANPPDWTKERPAPTLVTTRRSKEGAIVGRQLPAGEGENVGGWGWERPATTIAGDPRVFPPGGHIANDGRDNDKMVGRSQDAVRVTLAEAAVLQGFPADYPFQGTKTAQFLQVGNAVPPPLARAVLAELISEGQR